MSLFNDVASEMLIPVMPLFLKSIGFSVLFIGILEGVAEALAGLSKGYFGRLSDTTGKRLPFVQFGYGLSALAKPLMGLVSTTVPVFVLRTLDRFGKGIRTGARDALLSDESTPETKGTVFGFHRSMDTLGAVIGPALALVYLYFYPAHYRGIFLLSFFPGAAVLLTSFLLERKKNKLAIVNDRTSTSISIFAFFRSSSPTYKKVLLGLVVFALFNSSDVFLLLRAKQSGISDSLVILLYIFYNLIFALAAFPLGQLADKIGFRKMFLIGLTFFTLAYLALAQSGNTYFYFSIFFVYGLYAGATDGVAKAWLSNSVGKGDPGTALGIYGGLQSTAALIASSFAGLIWFKFGAPVTFLATAGVSLLVGVYFLFLKVDNKNKTSYQMNH